MIFVLFSFIDIFLFSCNDNPSVLIGNIIIYNISDNNFNYVQENSYIF